MSVCIMNIFIMFGIIVVLCVDFKFIIITIIIIIIIIIIINITPIGFIIIIFIIASAFNKRVSVGKSTNGVIIVILPVNEGGGSTWSGSEDWVRCVRVCMQYGWCVYDRVVSVCVNCLFGRGKGQVMGGVGA